MALSLDRLLMAPEEMDMEVGAEATTEVETMAMVEVPMVVVAATRPWVELLEVVVVATTLRSGQTTTAAWA